MLELQPQKLTTPDLGSVAYCYIHLLTYPALPSCRLMSCLPCCLLLSLIRTGSPAHPGFTRPCPSIPRKLRTLPPLTWHHQSLTLLPLPHLNHACHITVAAAPTMLPKSPLAWPSAAGMQLSDATTGCVPSLRPQTPSLSQKPQIFVTGPPTPLPMYASS